MIGAVDVARAHVTARTQFGRPIGSLQAVQHRLAEAHVQAQGSMWLARRAAWDLGSDRQAALAAAYAAAAAGPVFDAVHQMVGAIGFTTEFDLHLWSLRLPVLAAELGGPRAHAAAAAAAQWPAGPRDRHAAEGESVSTDEMRRQWRAGWRASGVYSGVALFDHVTRGIEEHGDDLQVFVDEHGRRRHTIGDLYSRALSVATAIGDAGLGPGDAVAVHMAHTPDAIVAYLAVSAAGADPGADPEHLLRPRDPVHPGRLPRPHADHRGELARLRVSDGHPGLPGGRPARARGGRGR